MRTAEEQQRETLRRSIARVRRRLDSRARDSLGTAGLALGLTSAVRGPWRWGLLGVAAAGAGWWAAGRPGAKLLTGAWSVARGLVNRGDGTNVSATPSTPDSN